MDIFLSSLLTAVLFLLFLCPRAARRGLRSRAHASFLFFTLRLTPCRSPEIKRFRKRAGKKRKKEEIWATAQMKRCKAKRTRGGHLQVGFKIPDRVKRLLRLCSTLKVR